MELAGKEIRVSVRNLVEFVLRSGDIDNRRTAGAQRDAMLAGSRLHRKLQKRMGAGYRSEVTLRHRVEEDGFSILVEGRADGIYQDEDEIVVDEIKGVYMDVGRLKEAVPVHMAQARCYGFFLAKIEDLPEISVQITYCNLETEEIRRFRERCTFGELEEWFGGLIHEYVKWARYLYHNEIRRDESIRGLEFPFPYREGQRELAVSVYRTQARKRRLFIQAPTGIGKTLSTVFPSLKAMGEGHGQKLFYLTARTITRSAAEEAFRILRERGLYFRSVTITAKEKLCILEKPECNPERCARAKGHYDRVNEAVYEILHREFAITREVILRYADEFQVCPFEFCLDISSFVDGIICDYNYVFDPDVRLKRYFADGLHGEYLFLVDEAHNLVGRAREMYSADLVKEDVLEIRNRIKDRFPRLARALSRLNRLLLELKRESEGVQILPDIAWLLPALSTVFSQLENCLEEEQDGRDREAVLDFYFTVRRFLGICERIDDHYRIYAELLEDGRFLLRCWCVNPIRNIDACLEQGNSTVFFSATMLPLRYYRMLLSDREEDYTVYVNSPFPRENRLLLLGRDVTSRYSRRNETEYRRVLDYIRTVAAARLGNYMVFFPSYQYMNQVLELWEEERETEFEVLVQGNRMSEEEREEFLREFERKREKSLAAFCVMGGMFSEGIDLKEERLIGVIAVGTGLPMVCTEQEVLRSYFEEEKRDGFAYAYQYPGMNKVLQAAGRVIRTPADLGVILLLDDRFLRRDYRELFPREWSDAHPVTLGSLAQELQAFWSRFPEAP